MSKCGFNIWHDIDDSRITKDSFTSVVEIPKGGKAKYELDKETGFLKLDRVLHAAVRYPMNYGFIPKTYAEDNDPLDVLIISDEKIMPLTLVQCRPIGVIYMVDNGENDEKILSVPFGDPLYGGYNNINEIPKYMFDEVCHFFEIYKTLENKKTSIEKMEGPESAKEVIEKCINLYSRRFKE